MEILAKWRRNLSGMPESQRHFTAGHMLTVVLVCAATVITGIAWLIAPDPRVGFAGIALVFASFTIGGVYILTKWPALEMQHRMGSISMALCGVVLLLVLVRLATSKGVIPLQ